MESAELKKEKRVRHCYPRKEVYHRWVHEETLVYHSRHIPVWGKYDWLFAGGYPAKTATREDIAKDWGYYGSLCIAVIDRNKKRALITHKWRNHSYSVKSAIPDDYEIFLTDDEIPAPYILRDDEAVCKLHIKYLIEQFTNWYITPLYNILAGRTKLIYKNPLEIFTDSNRNYKDIKDFVKKYKLRKYDWSKISLNENYSIRINNRMWWKTEKIAIPSINKFIKGTVFNKKELLLLEQKYFYSKHCYGRGILFKDVELYWNKEISSKEMCNYFNKHNIYWLDDYRTESCITWNDYVIRSHEIEEKHRSKYIEENIAKSNQNRKEAIEQANAIASQEDIILAWRNGSRIRDYKIDYREFVIPRCRGQYGTWRTSYIYACNISFKNTQLKLVGENVVTSRHASVPLSSAIAAFHLFDSCRSTYDATGKDRFTFPDRFNVGLYNLRDIQYVEKFADNGEKLGYKSWLIRIGCHNLWLDDIMNFIRYYHLEDQFLNRPEDNNKKKR